VSRREKLRQSMLDDIKATARRQMAENGTAGLSLSAIARELEVSQPALYRYYASRDDLVTVLIVDAFNAMADACETADAGVPTEQYGTRMLQVILAMREWALANPVDFQLIYGNPIPGYHAPEDETTRASWRTFAVILKILNSAHQAGKLTPRPQDLQHAATLIRSLPPDQGQEAIEPVIVHIGVLGWCLTHGMILLELFHHTTALVADPGAFYRYEAENLLRQFGLTIDIEE
jgi:AcrR family transcriptional regulator